MPRLGIALAAFRPNLDYFSLQLESISTQTFNDWVCVISFDSDPVELPQRFQNDSRFIAVRNPTSKKHKENFLFALASIEQIHPEIAYLSFCDQDDIWLPHKLETLVTKIEQCPPYSAVHSDLGLFKGDPVQIRSVWKFEGRKVDDPSLQHLFLRNTCTGASMIIDARLYREYGNIPASFTDHDHWFALMATLKGKLVPIHQILLLYRQHGENVIGAHSEPGIISLRKNWSWPNLVRHCIEENNCFEKRRADFPIDPNQKLAWANPSLLYWTLIVAITNGDKILFRRTVLVILGKIFRIFSLQKETTGSSR